MKCGLPQVTSVLECMGFRGYRTGLIFYVVLPCIISLFILLIAGYRTLLKTKTDTKAATDNKLGNLLGIAAPTLLQLAFLAYPLVATKAFEGFSCYEFTQSQWLKADVEIQCDSPEHDEVRRLAWAAILL